MPGRILVVEDDPMIGKTVVDTLRDNGMTVEWAKSGWEATGFLSAGTFDLVLLDLGLPGRDGMEVLTDLRARDKKLPVIIVTARDGLDDREAGLDAGADDYVLKPFHMRELLARMRAVLRRNGAGDAEEGDRILTNGQLSLNCTTKTVTVSDPEEGTRSVALSKREYDLLEALLRRPGAILSRAALEERVYAEGDLPGSNAIEFIIHGLRKKLGANAIGNVRGLGWMVNRPQR